MSNRALSMFRDYCGAMDRLNSTLEAYKRNDSDKTTLLEQMLVLSNLHFYVGKEIGDFKHDQGVVAVRKGAAIAVQEAVDLILEKPTKERQEQ